MADISRRAEKSFRSKMANRIKLSAFTRIVDRQEGRCWYCDGYMGVDCTREHLLARARGGGNEPENIRAAHGDCNSAAGHLSVEKKYELRRLGHEQGRHEMMIKAHQMRREQARIAFTRPDPGKKYWEKLGLAGKPSWWDG